jgi:uncharacterized protein (UPF0248 family)
MMPIRTLLNRIRWDADFGTAHFEIGYWDRVERRVVRVPLARDAVDAENPALLDLIGDDGEVHAVPLHRVRAVWRDGTLIWKRPRPIGPAAR